MNWGAAVLVLAGGAILVIGVTGSQKSVCAALTGSDCTWLPSSSGAADVQGATRSVIGVNPNETQSQINIDMVISSCRNSSSCSQYATLANMDASNSGIDPTDFVRQIAAESGFNPKALSPAGAEGIAQIMPATASAWGVNPWNPQQSLQAAANAMAGYERYWRQELNSSAYGFGGNEAEVEALSLSSYNYGIGGTQALARRYGASWLSHAPQETQNYISEIQAPPVTPATTNNVSG